MRVVSLLAVIGILSGVALNADQSPEEMARDGAKIEEWEKLRADEDSQYGLNSDSKNEEEESDFLLARDLKADGDPSLSPCHKAQLLLEMEFNQIRSKFLPKRIRLDQISQWLGPFTEEEFKEISEEEHEDQGQELNEQLERQRFNLDEIKNKLNDLQVLSPDTLTAQQKMRARELVRRATQYKREMQAIQRNIDQLHSQWTLTSINKNPGSVDNLRAEYSQLKKERDSTGQQLKAISKKLDQIEKKIDAGDTSDCSEFLPKDSLNCGIELCRSGTIASDGRCEWKNNPNGSSCYMPKGAMQPTQALAAVWKDYLKTNPKTVSPPPVKQEYAGTCFQGQCVPFCSTESNATHPAKTFAAVEPFVPKDETEDLCRPIIHCGCSGKDTHRASLKDGERCGPLDGKGYCYEHMCIDLESEITDWPRFFERQNKLIKKSVTAPGCKQPSKFEDIQLDQMAGLRC